MNKDEKKMIEDMRAIIQREHSDCMSNLCENCEYYAMNYCGSVKKANALHNAGCRIIGDDEIVVKKSEYETLKAQNDTLELSVKDLRYRNAQFSEANKLFAKRNDELLDELQGATAIKEKTAREIINMLTPPCKNCDANWHKGCMCLQKKIVKQISQKYGIESEVRYE